MKKIGLCLLAAMLCFAIYGLADAQGVKTGDKAFSAKEIKIDGSLDLCYGYLNSGITSILDNVPEGAVGNHQHSVFLLSPLVTLNFDIDLGEKVTAFVQLENRRLDGAADWADINGDGNVDTLWPTSGTAANVDVTGGDTVEPAIEQAYIKVSEFLFPELTFTIGIQDLKLTLRKGEGAFFVDVAGSELMAPGVAKAPPAAAFPAGNLALANADEWFITGAAFLRDTSEFGGMRFDYGDFEKNNYAACVFYGTVNETGAARTDEDLFGIAVDYKLPGENNVLKFLLANSASHGRKTPGVSVIDVNVMTLGVGFDYWVQPNIEVYGEFYSQSGDYGHYWNATVAPATFDALDHSASAYRIGGRYDVEHDLKPYVDLSMWYLSGDEGQWDDDNGDFLSYENVQSTLILEGNLLGLDLDSNYNAIKLEAGITTQFDINKDGTGEEVTLKLLYGQFTLAADPDMAGQVTGQVPLLGIDDALGQEIDIVATLKYSESLSFTFGIGMVTGADFFEGDDVNVVDGVNDSSYAMEDAGMTLVMFDTCLKF